jgi:hypothetical protein
MPSFESSLFYATVARDAAAVLRAVPRLHQLVDVNRWPKDDHLRADMGGTAHKPERPIYEDLHPALEQAVIGLITNPGNPEDHMWDMNTRSGNLLNVIPPACQAARASVSAYVNSQGGWEAAMFGLGQFTHRLIDVWNPFNLIGSSPDIEFVAARFMGDLETHIMELPFFWKFVDKPSTEFLKMSPYIDVMTTEAEVPRRVEIFLKPIADRYLAGNGWAAAKPLIQEWYDTVVNAVGRAWLFCASA